MKFIRVNIKDLVPDWLIPPSDCDQHFGHGWTAGNNLFFFFPDDWFDQFIITIPYTIVNSIPANALMNIGAAVADKLNLPVRIQPGKKSVEENE